MKGTSLKSITPPQAAGVLKTLIKHGKSARPPRPETETGSGGATGCEYTTVFTAYECLTLHHRILPCQPALARRDVGIQLFSLIMNASLCITAFCHARSGPGVWARGIIKKKTPMPLDYWYYINKPVMLPKKEWRSALDLVDG